MVDPQLIEYLLMDSWGCISWMSWAFIKVFRLVLLLGLMVEWVQQLTISLLMYSRLLVSYDGFMLHVLLISFFSFLASPTLLSLEKSKFYYCYFVILLFTFNIIISIIIITFNIYCYYHIWDNVQRLVNLGTKLLSVTNHQTTSHLVWTPPSNTIYAVKYYHLTLFTVELSRPINKWTLRPNQVFNITLTLSK